MECRDGVKKAEPERYLQFDKSTGYLMQREQVELLITFIVFLRNQLIFLCVCVCAYVCSDANNNTIHCFLIAVTQIQWLFITLAHPLMCTIQLFHSNEHMHLQKRTRVVRTQPSRCAFRNVLINAFGTRSKLLIS